MKVAFFGLEGWEYEIYEKKFEGKPVSVIRHEREKAMLDPSDLESVKEAEILSIRAGSVAGKKVIDSLPNLKMIATRTTGYDNIDVAYAKEKGIAAVNVPSYGDETVAEYTFALILTLSRKLAATYRRTLLGHFQQQELRGFDLEGKTLGVIGTGRIASRVIRMAHACNMKIIGFDPYPNKGLVEKYGLIYVELDELLKSSDIVTIHVPYMKATHHLINAEKLKLLKKGACLINAARGPIVDISALRAAIKAGNLGGVALDTFEGETVWIKEEEILESEDPPTAQTFKEALESFYLLNYPNVVLTPHNAFNTYEAVRRILDTNLDCIVAFAETGTCSCIIK
ncbi:MAG: NAD(P)-dependent oxidoreductase [Vulcanimicrobiota bacterium]